jgi:hypothetical protein
MTWSRHPHAQRTVLGLAGLAALTLAGCGNNTIYYQTRYVPTSSDEAFSPASQLAWSGDREVYELPAEPPAVDEDRPRIDCKQPAEVFKGQQIVGLTDNAPAYPDPNPPIALARSGDEPPSSALQPVKPLDLARFGDEDIVGAREPIGHPKVGITDPGPFPVVSSGKENPPLDLAKTRDADDWCEPKK